MAAHLPDKGEEVAHTQVFTWNIDHWSALPNIVRSNGFKCGGHTW